jgi:hypothetical protein
MYRTIGLILAAVLAAVGIVAFGATLPASATVDDYEVVYSELILTPVEASSLVANEVTCPVGKAALGGGGSAISSGAVWLAEYGRLSGGTPATGWQGQWRLSGSAPTVNTVIRVGVTCATED